MQLYYVYAQKQVLADDPEDNWCGEWQYVGRTRAVSEKKAINNVRYRMLGKSTTYGVRDYGSRYITTIDWKAERA